MHLRAATRGSPLAIWQTERVSALLQRVHPEVTVEAVVVRTEGDIDQKTPIEQLGGRGVFAKEVQAAVLDGRADIAVHSAKDLMSLPPDGLLLAAFPERGDVRDGLVGSELGELASGATVATGSIRRRAQLEGLRPDLTFVGLRGNMATRLARLDSVDAIVVACAGLDRLGLGDRIAERLDVKQFVPQVAQGALAVECRSDDSATIDVLAAIDDAQTRLTVTAERAYLAEVGGGCDLPVGALGTISADGGVTLSAFLATVYGTKAIRLERSGRAPTELGRSVARYILDDLGGAALLDELR